MWKYIGKTPAHGELYINKDKDICKVTYRKKIIYYYNRDESLVNCRDDYYPAVYLHSVDIERFE